MNFYALQRIREQIPPLATKKPGEVKEPDIEKDSQLTTRKSEEESTLNAKHTAMLKGVLEQLIGQEPINNTEPNITVKSEISKFISSEATLQLEQIQEEIKKLSINKNGSRSHIDLDSLPELGDRIEAWIKTHVCSEFKEPDFAPEERTDANTLMGEAWFGFERLIDLQNAESVVSEINRVSEQGYHTKNYVEKKELKLNLEDRLVKEFKLDKIMAEELSNISLIYKPLEIAIDKFIQNHKFNDKDWIEQEQLKKKFCDEAKIKHPIDPAKIREFFELKVELKEGKGAWATLKDLNERYKILKEHYCLVGGRMGLSLAGDAFLVAAPVLMSMENDFYMGFAKFFASTLGGVISKQCSQLCFNGLANKIEKKINEATTRAHHYREYQDMSRTTMGQIMEASRKGKESVINVLRNSSELPSLILQPMSAAALLLSINPYLGLTSLAGMATLGGIMGVHGIINSQRQREQLIIHEEAARKLDQTIGAIQEIRLSPNISKLEEDLRSKQNKGDDAMRSISDTGSYVGMSLSGTSLTTSLSTALIAGYLGVNPQQLISVVMYNGQILGPLIEGLGSVMQTFTEDVHAVNRLHKITGNPEEIVLPGSITEQSRVGISVLNNHKIEIKDLNFLNILRGINLTINEGDFITITGPSGIGKSTFLKSILGLLKPDSGSVTVGDTETKDIKKYDPEESLFKLVSYADQRPQVMIGETLRYNLLLGNENVSDERIREVMLQLGLYKESIDPGVDCSDPTVVNFSLDDVVDHDLSGGQKVRLGLARALLRDSKIILLDEPTASLDKGSAKGVRQLLTKIHRENPGTTIVCVSHDENLIEDSKRIGRTVSLSKEVNNLDTIEGLRELILSLQPELPDDAQKFLTEELFELAGIDIYDLRRVLIPHSNETIIYSDMIWSNDKETNRELSQ